jgi:hypothetical protein
MLPQITHTSLWILILSTQNIEYARSLLLRLEQEAADIKFQSKKQEAQIDLLQKRDVIESLSHRLKELDEACNL